MAALPTRSLRCAYMPTDVGACQPVDSQTPWAVEAILRLERPAPGHLRWPDLDVDLAVDSIEQPERYPLKSKA